MSREEEGEVERGWVAGVILRLPKKLLVKTLLSLFLDLLTGIGFTCSSGGTGVEGDEGVAIDEETEEAVSFELLCATNERRVSWGCADSSSRQSGEVDRGMESEKNWPEEDEEEERYRPFSK